MTHTAQSPERLHMRYLDWLIRHNGARGRRKDKRANWLHFCQVCGADISNAHSRQRLCPRHGGAE